MRKVTCQKHFEHIGKVYIQRKGQTAYIFEGPPDMEPSRKANWIAKSRQMIFLWHRVWQKRLELRRTTEPMKRMIGDRGRRAALQAFRCSRMYKLFRPRLCKVQEQNAELLKEAKSTNDERAMNIRHTFTKSPHVKCRSNAQELLTKCAYALSEQKDCHCVILEGFLFEKIDLKTSLHKSRTVLQWEPAETFFRPPWDVSHQNSVTSKTRSTLKMDLAPLKRGIFQKITLLPRDHQLKTTKERVNAKVSNPTCTRMYCTRLNLGLILQ